MADTQEQAEGKNRQTVYDAHGNVVGTVDAKGQSASSAFDARDRRVSETDRLAGVTTWRFDENSNLRHLADAENQSPYRPTAWTYDARNLALTETLPGHNPASQIGDADYDKKERRTGITYPDGSVVARQYTARDQLSQIDYNTDMVATFAYDAGSRRTSRVLGDTPGTQTAWVYGRQDKKAKQAYCLCVDVRSPPTAASHSFAEP